MHERGDGHIPLRMMIIIFATFYAMSYVGVAATMYFEYPAVRAKTNAYWNSVAAETVSLLHAYAK